MGAAAGPAGLRRVELPHYPIDQLAELLAWQFPAARRDDRPFEQFMRLTRDYWNARPVDFSDVACELPPPGGFTGQVLRACRRIAYGRTRSYGALAAQIGRPTAARAVAAVMARNPIPLVIPCHRVVYSDGRLGGFSAPGGLVLKRRMLQLEQAGARKGDILLFP